MDAILAGQIPPSVTRASVSAAPTPATGVPSVWGWVAVILFAVVIFFGWLFEGVVEDVTDAMEKTVGAVAGAAGVVIAAPSRAVRDLEEDVRSA